MVGGALLKAAFGFVMRHWKVFAVLGAIAGVYFYGHHKGWEAGQASNIADLQKADAKLAKLNAKNQELVSKVGGLQHDLLNKKTIVVTRIMKEPAKDCISQDPTFKSEWNSDPRKAQP